MRFQIALLLCLGMLAGFVYADQPTKTIAQGGWFALGGPGQMSNFVCGGVPCTDQAFANAFGSFISTIPVGATDLYESREQAISGFRNGDFSLDGDFCQPTDTGQPGALVSGFLRYYKLNDFTYEQLFLTGAVPSMDHRIMEMTQAIFMQLNDLDLGNLAINSGGQLIDPNDGQLIEPFTYQAAFADLDLKGYELITRWADTHNAVVNGFKVTNLQTKNITCP